MTMKKHEVVELYVDGACRGNPGPGGWGALLRFRGSEKILKGAVPNTTNNRMELTAAIEGLKALTRPCMVSIYTDSEYVQKGMTQWIKKWRVNQWRNGDNKPVKNVELWQELDALCHFHDIAWHWVRGHSGHPENERVDELARGAIDEL